MSAAALLSGDGAGQQAAAADTTAPAAGTDPATQAASTAQSAATNGTEPWWHGRLSNDDNKGWLANKGFKDLDTWVESHKNLEKLVGEQRLAIPKGDEDKANWDKVFNALGRPEKPEAYQFKAPEGKELNPEMIGHFAPLMHELGLNQRQASGLVEAYTALEATKAAQEATAFAAKSDQDIRDLRTEWGETFDSKIEVGRRAMRQFGMTESVDALEKAMGTKGLLSLLAKIGEGLGEHRIENGGGSTTFGLTPAAAQQKIADLKADRAWSKAYIEGDAGKREEMARLMRAAYPDQAA